MDRKAEDPRIGSKNGLVEQMLTHEELRTALTGKHLIFTDHVSERLEERGIAKKDVIWGIEHVSFQKNGIENEKKPGSSVLVIGWKQNEKSFRAVFSRGPNESVINLVTAYEYSPNFYRELKERRDFTMSDKLPVAKPAQKVAEAPEQTKKCIKCGKVKPLTEFNKNSSSPDSLHYYCKTCTAEAARAYVARKKEREGNVKETTMKGQVMLTVNDPDFKFLVASLLRAEGYDILNDRPTSFVVEFEKQLTLKPKAKEVTA